MLNTRSECRSVMKGKDIPLSHASTLDILVHAALHDSNMGVAVSCIQEFERRQDNNLKTDKVHRAEKNQQCIDFISHSIVSD